MGLWALINSTCAVNSGIESLKTLRTFLSDPTTGRMLHVSYLKENIGHSLPAFSKAPPSLNFWALRFISAMSMQENMKSFYCAFITSSWVAITGNTAAILEEIPVMGCDGLQAS